MWNRWVGSILVAMTLAGCASVIPEDVLVAADRGITLPGIRSRPQHYLGRTVLLGGEILQVTPKQGQTEVEVLERPLGRRDRPQETDESRGRFLVMMDGFLDPAVYRAGREVTVVGEVRGLAERPIGEVMYGFPILQGRYLYLWPDRPPIVYERTWPDPYWSHDPWFWHRHRFHWYW